MQTILKSHIGTFVGKDGRLFYRCSIQDVDYSKNSIIGEWIGTAPPSTRVNNWTASYIVGNNRKQNNVDRFRFNNNMYINVPKNILIGEELLVEELRPDVE